MTGRLHLRIIQPLILIGLVILAAPASAEQAQEPIRIQSFTASGSQTGGKDITRRVVLTAPAPAGGIKITFAASRGAVNDPPSVIVTS